MVGRPQDDAELVQRAQRGDVGAYEIIVARHQEPAFRAAYLVTRNAADAEDATQEAFMKAYAALGHFDAARPLRPWLLRIVVNEARNRRRAEGRREHLAASPAPTSSACRPGITRGEEFYGDVLGLRFSKPWGKLLLANSRPAPSRLP